MEKETVEKSIASVDQSLAKYQDLMGKRAVYQDRLKKAEQQKTSVKDGIFLKVCREYRKELKKLEEEIRPIKMDMKKARDVLANKVNEIDELTRDLRDKLDELAFRHRIGEFVDTELDKRAEPLRKQAEELGKRRTDLVDKLKQFDLADDETDDDEMDDEFDDDEVLAAKSEIQRIAEEAEREDSAKEKSTRQPGDVEPPPEAQSSVKKKDPEKKAATPTAQSPREEQPKTKTAAQSSPTPSKKTTAQTSQDIESTAPIAKKTGGSTPVKEEDSAPKKKAAEEAAPQQAGKSGGRDNLVDLREWSKEFQEGNGAKTTQQTATKDPLTELADPDDTLADLEPSPKQERGKGFPILVIMSGPGVGKKFPVVPMTMTIGREHDNNIELKDQEVSRYHARILYQGGKYQLQDLESSSGTWLNDEKISESPLEHGDKIRMGNTELMLDFS
jgi:hypothetical protein